MMEDHAEMQLLGKGKANDVHFQYGSLCLVATCNLQVHEWQTFQKKVITHNGTASY